MRSPAYNVQLLITRFMERAKNQGRFPAKNDAKYVLKQIENLPFTTPAASIQHVTALQHLLHGLAYCGNNEFTNARQVWKEGAAIPLPRNLYVLTGRLWYNHGIAGILNEESDDDVHRSFTNAITFFNNAGHSDLAIKAQEIQRRPKTVTKQDFI